MRRFLTAASVMVVLLIIGIVTYNIIDASLTLNNREQLAQDEVINEAKNLANLSLDKIYNPSGGTAGPAPAAFLKYFSPDLVAGYLAGDPAPLYGLIVDVFVPLYGIDAALITSNGQVVGSHLPEGVTPQDFPAPAPGEQSKVVDSFGSQNGHFLVWYVPLQLLQPGQSAWVTAVIDRTDEINRIQSEFNQARRNLLIRQLLAGIAAILISLLIVLIGLRLLARKYITGPINELGSTASGIMDGTYHGKVEVNSESDYAAIQSLLQSGQAIITKIDNALEENPDA